MNIILDTYENNQVKFDNTVVWRDFTAKDFEEALKMLCNVEYFRKHGLCRLT